MSLDERTKGQIEAEISEAIVQFEKNYMGRGPEETRAYLIDDLVLVRLKGVMTRAELQLAQSERRERGRDLIKQVRIELLEEARPLLEEIVRSATGRKLRSLHTDISTKTGERVIIFILESAVQG